MLPSFHHLPSHGKAMLHCRTTPEVYVASRYTSAMRTPRTTSERTNNCPCLRIYQSFGELLSQKKTWVLNKLKNGKLFWDVFLGGLSHLILKTHTFPTAENSLQLFSVFLGGKASSRRESKPSACASCGHRLASPCWLKYQSSSYMSRTPQKPLKLGTNPTIRLPSWFRTHKWSIDLTFFQVLVVLNFYPCIALSPFATSKYPPSVGENHILLSSKL